MARNELDLESRDPTSRSTPSLAVLILSTSLALLAFAGNSLLCREVLSRDSMTASTFTLERIASGALTLALLVGLRSRGGFRKAVRALRVRRVALSSASLLAYALPFALAYETLTAGTGALILFGVVQGTIVSRGLFAGERLGLVASAGFLAAAVGLVVLVGPGVTRPPLLGSGLMALAGLAWGIYTLLGRSSSDPLLDTGASFVGSTLLFAPLAPLFVDFGGTTRDHMLAVTSGAVTSGLGYALWYAALPALTRMRAALLQLAVPVIAATGGALVLAEPLTMRLSVASALVLGGIGVAIRAKQS